VQKDYSGDRAAVFVKLRTLFKNCEYFVGGERRGLKSPAARVRPSALAPSESLL
jgi:hypothetical protein